MKTKEQGQRERGRTDKRNYSYHALTSIALVVQHICLFRIRTNTHM
jgi:hypothetical protein